MQLQTSSSKLQGPQTSYAADAWDHLDVQVVATDQMMHRKTWGAMGAAIRYRVRKLFHSHRSHLDPISYIEYRALNEQPFHFRTKAVQPSFKMIIHPVTEL
eukprot:s311_g24.t1